MRLTRPGAATTQVELPPKCLEKSALVSAASAARAVVSVVADIYDGLKDGWAARA